MTPAPAAEELAWKRKKKSYCLENKYNHKNASRANWKNLYKKYFKAASHSATEFPPLLLSLEVI